MFKRTILTTVLLLAIPALADECSKCNATGRCENCEGTGSKTCLSCMGSGEFLGEKCPACKGRGEKKCSECNGSGKCRECHGRGEK